MAEGSAHLATQRPPATKQVGRYQTASLIGQGAMANVYRAHDPEIQRDLAIKVLNQQFRRDPECVARFLREARAAGSLSHPNIVTVYDVGETRGFPYIAMELLSGETLDKRIEARGAFSIAETLHVAIQLADALRYAHDLGIVHRDIKPSNIVLTADGAVKLLDFGIARVAESGAKDAAAETVKTQVGQVLGTPRYMSPEQALGQSLDGRSDLFSLGAIIYEMICGRPAFDGTSIATLAIQITTQQPAPIDVTPECPRGLRFIIDKLLSKRPEKRFANGAELLEALRRESAAWTAEATEQKGRRLPLHLRFTLLASAIVAAALTLGIGWVLDQQYRAMERVAIASGSSIASFVASNTALHMIENASRPDGEADWLPVQAFVKTAAADPNITEMMVIDRKGVIQAAGDPALVGARYEAPARDRLIDADLDVSLSSARAPGGADTFRFTRPIVYAGRNVGQVDVSLRKDELESAAGLTLALLIGLGALMMSVALGLSFLGGHLVLRSVRRLNAALKDAAQGKLDFRISHQRKDEFGELFDSFNALAAGMQQRLDPSPLEQVDVAATLLRSVAGPDQTSPDAAPAEKQSA